MLACLRLLLADTAVAYIAILFRWYTSALHSISTDVVILLLLATSLQDHVH